LNGLVSGASVSLDGTSGPRNRAKLFHRTRFSLVLREKVQGFCNHDQRNLSKIPVRGMKFFISHRKKRAMTSIEASIIR
jgi:hypothetical protein